VVRRHFLPQCDIRSRADRGPKLASKLVRAEDSNERARRRSTPMDRDARKTQRTEGKVLVPAILYIAGVPLSVVLLLWLFFFRG
jgi:hypothetical protein